jgi:hypothetical protein
MFAITSDNQLPILGHVVQCRQHLLPITGLRSIANCANLFFAFTLDQAAQAVLRNFPGLA